MNNNKRDQIRSVSYCNNDPKAPFNGNPRVCKNANAPGSYEIAIRTIRQTINPGEKITFDVFITGYGKILGNKLLFYPPSDFINGGKVNFGIRAMASQDNKLIINMGYDILSLDSKDRDMFTVNISGPSFGCDGRAANTPFFDVNNVNESNINFPCQIATEVRAGDDSGINPPFRFELTTHSDVGPGNHSLQLLFTYFNGIEWKTSIANLTIRVRPLHERRQGTIATLGIILALVAMLPSYLSLLPEDKKLNNVTTNKVDPLNLPQFVGNSGNEINKKLIESENKEKIGHTE